MNSCAANPQITVVLPTYNRANFLREALSSLRLQTLTKSSWRVVVLDNASTDSTREVVASFSDLPLVYDRSTSNLGSYANFERGFRNYMDTEFFAMLCDDDLYAPHFLQTALAGFEAHANADLFACGAIFGSAVGDMHRGLCDLPCGGLKSQVTEQEHHVRWHYEDWLVLHSVCAPIILPSCMFRASALRQIVPVFQPDVACSDRWMLAQFGARFVCYSTPWPASLIRFHASNGWLQLAQDARARAEIQCSELVRALCRERGVDIIQYWARLSSSVPNGLPDRLKLNIMTNYPKDMARMILGRWEPNTGLLSQLGFPATMRPPLRAAKRLLSRLVHCSAGN